MGMSNPIPHLTTPSPPNSALRSRNPVDSSTSPSPRSSVRAVFRISLPILRIIALLPASTNDSGVIPAFSDMMRNPISDASVPTSV